MFDVNRSDLERVVGKFSWVEDTRGVRILLNEDVAFDERRLLKLFPGYRTRDRGKVLELIPEVR